MNGNTTRPGFGVVVRRLRRLEDSRGWFLKVLMRDWLESPNRNFGEIYLTAAHPGQVKGNHYHCLTTEWFCVVQGSGCLVTRDVETGETQELPMAADDPVVVRVSPNIAHAILNVGEGVMILLAYADQPYDADDPDEVRYSLVTAES